MDIWEGEQKGGRVPYFAFELISKTVILFIFNGGMLFLHLEMILQMPIDWANENQLIKSFETSFH